ncbi:MAG: S8 family serine peptidase, partial [Pyrinomonadaceae bacterium]
MAREKRIKNNRGWRWLTAVGMSMSLLAGIVITEGARAQTQPNPDSSANSLTKYATDLTAAADQGRFNDLDERTEETDRTIQILASSQKNNPVVISESQAIRDLVFVSVARRMAHGNVPEELAGKRLFKLDLDSLFRDSKTAEELTTNLSAILSDVTKSDARIILIIDPIQSLVGSSAAFNGAASSLLREAISNGQVQCFGASTEIAFQENVAKEESLAPLFTVVNTEAVAGASEEKADDSAKSNQHANGEGFAGDNVAPDIREMIESSKAPERVKVILQVSDANSASLQEQLKANGIIITGQMTRFGALVVDMPTKAIAKFAESGSAKYMSLDREVAGLGHVAQTTGMNAMQSQSGNASLDGSSIGIAILDSGISTKHPSLSGHVVYSKDFTGEGKTDDPYGHGTFVASMIATGQGKYGGTAPGAKLVNFRVLNSKGTGKTSSVLNALDAVLANRATYNIRVVNMSLGTTAVDSYKNDAICRAVRRLVDAGIVVVAAAGNDGKDILSRKVYGRIHSPGNEPSAITVGAANTFGSNGRKDDVVTSFSSRGPTRSYWKDSKGKHYDNVIKPDLVAPGNKIIGASSANNGLLGISPDLSIDLNSASGSGNMRLSGTSVSSPIVAGAVAILLEANPKLTPNM